MDEPTPEPTATVTLDPEPEPTDTSTVVDSGPYVVQVHQDQVDMILGGLLVIVFLLAAILFAQMRRPQ